MLISQLLPLQFANLIANMSEVLCHFGAIRNPLAEEDTIHGVDYATRRRQLLTLEQIQALATTLKDMAKHLGRKGAIQTWARCGEPNLKAWH